MSFCSTLVRSKIWPCSSPNPCPFSHLQVHRVRNIFQSEWLKSITRNTTKYGGPLLLALPKIRNRTIGFDTTSGVNASIIFGLITWLRLSQNCWFTSFCYSNSCPDLNPSGCWRIEPSKPNQGGAADSRRDRSRRKLGEHRSNTRKTTKTREILTHFKSLTERVERD